MTQLSKILILFLIILFLITTLEPIEQLSPIITFFSIIELCPIEQFEPILTFLPIKMFFPYLTLSLKKLKSRWNGVFCVSDSRRNPYFNILMKNNKNGFKRCLNKPFKEIYSRQKAPKTYDHIAGYYCFRKDYLLKKKNSLFEGRDLNSTIDARSIYASAMSSVFDTDFEKIKREVFWEQNIKNYSENLFKS